MESVTIKHTNMNYIKEEFEKRTGLSHINLECRYPTELTIFQKGVEAGRFYEAERIEALRNKIQELEAELAELKSGITLAGTKSIPTITDDGNVSCMPAHYEKVLNDNFDELIYKPTEE